MSAAADQTQLDGPVTTLPGIGPSAAQKLARLGIETLADLLLHLPFRYQDRTRSIPINELTAGANVWLPGKSWKPTSPMAAAALWQSWSTTTAAG